MSSSLSNDLNYSTCKMQDSTSLSGCAPHHQHHEQCLDSTSCDMSSHLSCFSFIESHETTASLSPTSKSDDAVVKRKSVLDQIKENILKNKERNRARKRYVAAAAGSEAMLSPCSFNTSLSDDDCGEIDDNNHSTQLNKTPAIDETSPSLAASHVVTCDVDNDADDDDEMNGYEGAEGSSGNSSSSSCMYRQDESTMSSVSDQFNNSSLLASASSTGRKFMLTGAKYLMVCFNFLFLLVIYIFYQFFKKTSARL